MTNDEVGIHNDTNNNNTSVTITQVSNVACGRRGSSLQLWPCERTKLTFIKLSVVLKCGI